MHTVTGACPKGDALLSLCAESTSTILVSGDSAGRLKVRHLLRARVRVRVSVRVRVRVRVTVRVRVRVRVPLALALALTLARCGTWPVSPSPSPRGLVCNRKPPIAQLRCEIKRR